MPRNAGRLVPLVLASLVVAGSLEAANPDEPGQAASGTSAAAGSSVYVQAGLLSTTQPAGIANHRVTPAISGSAIGWAAAVGSSVTPTVAIEGEVTGGGTISTPQRFSYNWREDYIGESRDVFLGVNARWRPAARRPLELVGGAAVVVSRFANRSIVVTRSLSLPPRPPTTEPDEVSTSGQLALGGGMATPLAVSRRIEVVPAFTMRWIGRFEQRARRLCRRRQLRLPRRRRRAVDQTMTAPMPLLSMRPATLARASSAGTEAPGLTAAVASTDEAAWTT